MFKHSLPSLTNCYLKYIRVLVFASVIHTASQAMVLGRLAVQNLDGLHSTRPHTICNSRVEVHALIQTFIINLANTGVSS